MRKGLTIKNYRDWSIKLKLLSMTGLLLLGSVFLESYLSYTQYTRDFERQSSEKVNRILEQVALNMDTYLDELYRLTLFPYRNATIMAALEEGTPDTELGQLEKRRLIENYLDEVMIYPRKDIIRVSILTDEIYSSARLPSSVVPNEEVSTYDWYKRALRTQEYIFVPGHMQPADTGGLSVFSIVKQLRSTANTQQIIGVIKADANYEGITDIIRKAKMGQNGGLFIVDDKNNFVYSADPALESLAAAAPAEGSVIRDGFLLNAISLPRVQWKIVAASSVSEMNREAVKTRNTAFLFAVCSSLFAILVLVLFIRRFLQPLLSIVRLMKEVERGRLDIQFHSARKDEIGYLGSAFNRLVGKISEMLAANTNLVKEVYETKLLQKEAQINTLNNQIRPHFIFNTLNLISLTMQSGHTDKAIEHIHRLSNIMRSMAQWDKEVPLRREIDLLHAYLGIQSSRYEGRLDYEIEIDPALDALRIPALLLQPAVENAVIHGCERKKGKTTIKIRSEKQTDRLLLIVEDDGPGMETERLESLRRKIRMEEEPAESEPASGTVSLEEGGGAGTGIGLLNVNRRLQAKYGAAYGIAVDSRPGEGTSVRIALPIPESMANGGEHDHV